jgi:hypothetical protein
VLELASYIKQHDPTRKLTKAAMRQERKEGKAQGSRSQAQLIPRINSDLEDSTKAYPADEIDHVDESDNAYESDPIDESDLTAEERRIFDGDMKRASNLRDMQPGFELKVYYH